MEGVEKSQHPGAEAVICRHDDTVTGIGRGVQRLMEQKSAPTAILVANAYHYLAVASRLAQLGRKIPEDVSVVSRDDDLFLSYLVPEPARYVFNSHAFAKSLIGPISELLENTALTRRELRLIPEFVRGDSLGRPTELPLKK